MVASAEARQICRAAGSLLNPSLDFGAKVTGTYPSEDFTRVLTRSAFEREFTNTSARHLQLARGDTLDLEDRSPLAKSLLYNLGTKAADAIDGQSYGVQDQYIRQTRSAHRFPNTAEVALDLYKWLYCGSKQTAMGSRINPDRGINLAYVFVTLCIVSPAVRITGGLRTLISQRRSGFLRLQAEEDINQYVRDARNVPLGGRLEVSRCVGSLRS